MRAARSNSFFTYIWVTRSPHCVSENRTFSGTAPAHPTAGGFARRRGSENWFLKPAPNRATPRTSFERFHVTSPHVPVEFPSH